MSDSEDDPGNHDNVFLNLVALPGQWDHQSIYTTLGTILRNATPEEFDAFITDCINFAKTAHARVVFRNMDMQSYVEFIHVCTNSILHWVFASRGRRASADIVRNLMERTSVYLQDHTDNLAIAWRSFTPLYGPSSLGGVTPLMFVAQNRQVDVLKVLLQYGMLERERRPTYIIISILFDPPRLEALHYRSHATVKREQQECMALCFRVLKYISIADIEMEIIFGREPLIDDWRDHIPRRRCQEPCELSHLCRVSIRGSLLLRDRLPDGIKALPLPTAIHSYLNLES